MCTPAPWRWRPRTSSQVPRCSCPTVLQQAAEMFVHAHSNVVFNRHV